MGANPVAPYLPGTQFAFRYLFPQRSAQFTPISEDALPAMAGPLQQLTGDVFHAGKARYRIQDGGQSGEGAMVCITRRISSGAFASWYVYRLAMAEAPQGRLPEAEQALAQIAGNLSIDPGWLRREAVKAGANSRILADMTEAVSNSIRSDRKLLIVNAKNGG